MHHLLHLKNNKRILQASISFLTATGVSKRLYCVLSAPAISSPPSFPTQSHTDRPEINGHVISPNKKITSYVRCGDLNSALEIFRSMKMRNTVSWNSILTWFVGKPRKLREAQQLFDEIPEPDDVSYNLMLACYFRNGDVEAANEFFNKIPVKDTASWNTMISGLSWNGMMDEARELFVVMPRRNLATCNAMISGYIECGNMKSALELFVKVPVKNVVDWRSIITGYMRSGNVELAEKIFDEMPDKNLVTWNAMISGYVENGRGEDALKLFKKMLELEILRNKLICLL